MSDSSLGCVLVRERGGANVSVLDIRKLGSLCKSGNPHNSRFRDMEGVRLEVDSGLEFCSRLGSRSWFLR